MGWELEKRLKYAIIIGMLKNKRTLIKALVAVLGLLLLVNGETLQVPKALAITIDPNLGNPMATVLQVMASFTTFLQIALFICLQMVSWLMNTSFFTDPAMMGMLRSIWVLSRDIMNMLFALMLIGVAFYTIIVADGTFVKSKISTFVMGVILVNFSWFFPRVIIDVANVLTSTIYSIPNMLPNFDCKSIGETGAPEACKVVTKIVIFPTLVEEGDPDFSRARGGDCYTGIVCWHTELFNTAAPTMNAAHATINGLAVSFARLTTMAKVPANPGPPGAGIAGVLTSLKLMINILMVFVIQIALVFPLLGLAVGLLIRIVVLWATIAFMPFAFLGFVINDKKLGTGVFGFEDYIWKNFIGAAFLPVTVAIPIVIGFIMLSSMSSIPPPTGTGLVGPWRFPVVAGVSSWWSFLWMIAALMIIWRGAFDALSKFDAAKGITDKIKGYGEMIGGAAAQLPLLTPIPLPGGGGGKQSIGQIVGAPRMLADAIRTEASGRGSGSLRKTFDNLRGVGVPPVPGGGAPAAAVTAEARRLEGDRAGSDRIVAAIRDLRDPGKSAAALDQIKTEMRGLNIAQRSAILPELRRVAQAQKDNGAGALKDSLADIDGAIAAGVGR